MPELDVDAIKQLVKLGATAAPIFAKDATVPYALVPEGFKLEDLSKFIYNEHRSTPERVKQNVKVLDVESFVGYYTLFSDPNSRIFAYEPECAVKAVLDYHAAGEGNAARWGNHTLTLSLLKSVEWQRWLGNNNQHVSQQSFAEFLEQNGLDISSPSPAAMMEVAKDLQATTEVQFGSGLRMQDGRVQFKYTEETKSTVGGSALTVPDRFTLSIPVFFGSERIPLEALLRFRVKEGRLTFWYTLIRPEEVVRQAFLAARNRIAEELKANIINGQVA